MKKVYYATGTLGALGAIPALGLVPPAATAATHVSARTGKTVSLVSLTHRIPDFPCDARTADAGSSSFGAVIWFSRDTGCIGKVIASLKSHTSSGWWLRVRSYIYPNHLQWSRFNKDGHIITALKSISFNSFPDHRSITQVCEAMVRSSHSGTVKYGPFCEPTGF